jgi:hypothetical protein
MWELTHSKSLFENTHEYQEEEDATKQLEMKDDEAFDK